jgi:cell wall assembly regulator SMI1
MSSIAQSWQRIGAWYAQNTPKDTLVLADGASEAEIAELEAALGQRLPDDVRESLALHNGAANEAYLLYFGELLSTAHAGGLADVCGHAKERRLGAWPGLQP